MGKKFPISQEKFPPATDAFATKGSQNPPTSTSQNTAVGSNVQFGPIIDVNSVGKANVGKSSEIVDVIKTIAAGSAPVIPMDSQSGTGAIGKNKTTKTVGNKSNNEYTQASQADHGAAKQKGAVSTGKFVSDAMLGIDERVDVSNDKFTVFEKITGLSQERPEIIQMMNYLPLFEKDVGAAGYSTSDPTTAANAGIKSSADYGFTPAGELFDTLYKHRLIKINNLQTTHNVIATDKRYGSSAEFENALNDVTNVLRTLFGLNQMGSVLKVVLGVRNTLCNLQKTFTLLAKGELRSSENENDQDLMMYDNMIGSMTMSPLVAKGTATVPQVLNLLGYNLDAAKNVFSSTKLWMQLLYELHILLKFSSDQMLNTSTQMQETDVDPLVINKHTPASTRMGGRSIGYKFPTFNSVMSLTNLKDNDALNSFIDTLLSAHSDEYRFVSFDSSETKIAALVNFLSQEYRYSYALKQPRFQTILRNEYNYTVIKSGDDGSNNVGFLDAVLGKIPNNVTDIVTDNPGQSLVSIAQQVVAQVDETRTVSKKAILPLEMRYLETGNSTYTPGGVHLVDEVLTTTDGKDFNIAALQSYYDVVTSALQSLIPVTLGCDMYMFGSETPGKRSGDYQFESPAERKVYGDPRHLFVTLFKILAPVSAADSDNQLTLGPPNTTFNGFGKEGWHNDAIWSIFSYATKNPRVLALLFIIMASHIPAVTSSQQTMPSDRRLVIDALMNELESSFVTATSTSNEKTKVATASYQNAQQAHEINEIPMRAKLQNGEVVKFLAGVMATFSFTVDKLLQTVMGGGLSQSTSRSQYSGIPNVLFNFLAFELMCLLFDSYGNVHLKHVSPSSSQNSKLSFQYTLTSYVATDHSPTNVYSRLEAERARIQGTLLATMSVITEIGFGLKTFLSALTPSVKTQTALNTNIYATMGSQALRQMSDLFNDPMYVNLMLGEQQLMTALNGVYDIRTQIDKAKDAETAYAIIDDAADDPNKTVLLDVLYSIFSDKHFQSMRGYNKRIITVGLPTGFSHNFKHRKSNASKSAQDSNSKEYTSKVNDVIRVVTRKIDVRYNEIVFKPMMFLFDLSRYPARTGKLMKLENKNVTLENLSSHVGTRDYGSINPMMIVPTTVEYYSSINSPKNYPFLTTDQSAQLYRNHTLSYLLEVYVRILTGLNVSENAFTFRTTFAPQFNPLRSTATLGAVANLGSANANGLKSKKKMGVLAGGGKNSNAPAKNSSDIESPPEPSNEATDVNAAFGVLLAQNADGLMSKTLISQVAAYVRTFSTMSNDVYAKQRMLLPKHFERVFNIIIDPDDFEIDVIATKSSPAGQLALDSLVSQGELIIKPMQVSENSDQETIRYVSRDKTEADVSFEKYIINIESFENDGV